MNVLRIWATVALASTAGLPVMAHAHSRLVFPPGRTEEDFLTVPPCGERPVAATRTAIEAGSTIDMSWILTVNHRGTFRIAFSPEGEDGFDANVLGTLPDVDDVLDYTQPVPMPMCVCDGCILQLAQLTVTGNAGYYSCADIELMAPDGMDLPDCTETLPTGDGGSTSGNPIGDTGAGTTTATPTSGGSTTAAASGDEGDDGSSSGCRSTDPRHAADGRLLGLLPLVVRRRRGNGR